MYTWANENVNAAARPGHLRRFVMALACLVLLGAGLGINQATKSGEQFTANFASTVSTAANTVVASSVLPGRRPVVLVMGDSITEFGADPNVQGWSSLLQYTYVRSIDLVNRGLRGCNTQQFRDQVLPVLTEELSTSFTPVLMTLWLGANDAALPMGASARLHVPVDQYRDNLVYILTQFRTLAPHAKVLLISQPVVDDDTRIRIRVRESGPGHVIDRSNEQAAIYAAAARKAAETVDGVAFLDMYSYLNTTYPDAAGRQSILDDGLHLNTKGNRVAFEKINELVRSLLPPSLIDTLQITLKF